MDFEEYCDREDQAYEEFIRNLYVFAFGKRKARFWLFVRANRPPEEIYGMPDDETPL